MSSKYALLFAAVDNTRTSSPGHPKLQGADELRGLTQQATELLNSDPTELPLNAHNTPL